MNGWVRGQRTTSRSKPNRLLGSVFNARPGVKVTFDVAQLDRSLKDRDRCIRLRYAVQRRRDIGQQSGVGSVGHLVLVFQSGIGNLDPDWAAFLLGDTDGSWSISGAQALSHASLFGVRSTTTSVPEPITMGLLGVGLLGLGLAARRRRTS